MLFYFFHPIYFELFFKCYDTNSDISKFDFGPCRSVGPSLNRGISRSKAAQQPSSTPLDNSYNPKLQKKCYNPKSPALETAVNEITNSMAHDLDSRLRRRSSLAPKKSNLSAAELIGLKWLEKQTREDKISVVEADKGGAILIVYPNLLKRKTLEKLQDPSLYDKLPDDPTHKQHKKLFDLWVEGKTKGLISPSQAKEVMGISDNLKSDGSGPTNRPSTSPHFKPGISYFYLSLKIHKEQLTPEVEPPIRLITALQDGIIKRSDVFLEETYLRDPEKDFFADLLQDSSPVVREY